MMYGGTLSSRRSRWRDDLSVEFQEMDLDQRLPQVTRSRTPDAAARLAALGVLPGRYSGAEQVFEAGASALAPAMDLAACAVTETGSLVVASRATGDTTTFAWTSDRWRWSPHLGLTIEATPRRVGAIVVVDFVAWEGSRHAPAARLYLAADPTR
jgi:hypothetical protein